MYWVCYAGHTKHRAHKPWFTFRRALFQLIQRMYDLIDVSYDLMYDLMKGIFDYIIPESRRVVKLCLCAYLKNDVASESYDYLGNSYFYFVGTIFPLLLN